MENDMYSTSKFEFTNEAAIGADVTIDASAKEKRELLERIAQGLSFPDYFGENWDALIDCLSDLSWLEKAEVIIDHAAVPKLYEMDTRLYLESLIEAVDRRGPDQLPRLRVLFRTADRPVIVSALAPG
jgi:RNAse (barnase) inhibitor barstar